MYNLLFSTGQCLTKGSKAAQNLWQTRCFSVGQYYDSLLTEATSMGKSHKGNGQHLPLTSY